MPSEKELILGLIQMHCSKNPQENIAKAIQKVGEAAREGAKIICLQELFRYRYFCQEENPKNFELAEEIPGPTTEIFSKIAQEKEVVLLVPVFEKRAHGIYHNSVVTIDADGSIIGKYRKMHIPDDPLYYEKYYFTPGDIGFKTIKTRYAKIGTLICWDQWFPEAARLTSLGGTQIIFCPTAIAWHPQEKMGPGKGQLDAWITIQRSHAIANGVFLVAVNRVGREDGLMFWGNSFVCDPFGEIIAKSTENEEDVLIVQCDLSKIDETRHNWPFLRDRRIDAYRGLEKRFLD